MKVTNIIMVLFIIFCFSSCKKERLNQQAEDYLADYNEFVDTLKTCHPALYEFTSKITFNKKTDLVRSQIDNNEVV